MTEKIKPIKEKLFAISIFDKNGKFLHTTFHEDISEEEVRKKLQAKYSNLPVEWFIADYSTLYS